MWSLFAFVVGIPYGRPKPGAQDKSQMLVHGLIIGLVVSVVLALIGVVGFDSHPVGLGSGFLGIAISVVLVTQLLVLGAWLGDLLEGKPRRT